MPNTDTVTPEAPVEEPTATNPAPAEGQEPEALETPVEAPESGNEEPDTFPRDYVEKLRKEAATYRERAKRSDELARELFAARVQLTGRLADPSDLAYDEALLSDSVALTGAIDELLARKPHLASRRPHGSIGQGVGGGNSGDVNLADLLRGRA